MPDRSVIFNIEYDVHLIRLSRNGERRSGTAYRVTFQPNKSEMHYRGEGFLLLARKEETLSQVSNMSGQIRNMSGQIRIMSGQVRNMSGQARNMSGEVRNISGTYQVKSPTCQIKSGTCQVKSGTC